MVTMLAYLFLLLGIVGCIALGGFLLLGRRPPLSSSEVREEWSAFTANSGPPNPTRLQKRLVAAVVSGAAYVAITGERRVMQHVAVALSPADYDVLASLPQPVERTAVDIAIVARRKLEARKAVFSGPFTVVLTRSTIAEDGRPLVTARQPTQVAESAQQEPAAAIPKTRLLQTARLVPGSASGSTEPIRLDTTTGGRFDLGRSGDIRLDHPEVSGRHATITIEGGSWFLADDSSRNGTFVNGTRTTATKLANGDEIRFSNSGPSFVFESVGDPQ